MVVIPFTRRTASVCRSAVVSALALLACLGAPPCLAQTVYLDQSAFFTATGATSATGTLPDLGINNLITSPITLGSVTYSLGPRANAFSFSEWSNELPRERSYIPGNEMAVGDHEDFNLDLAAPVYSIGFLTSEPTETHPSAIHLYVDSLFTATLFNGVTPVGSFQFNPVNDAAGWVGAHSAVAFNRVEVRETNGNLLNEYFGEIYTGTTPPGAVPEPGSFILLAPVLILLVSVRRFWRGPAVDDTHCVLEQTTSPACREQA